MWDIVYHGNYTSDIHTLIQFYMARSGSLFSFRFKDFTDFTTASDGVSAHAFDNVQIGTGDGSTTTFQLVKKYTSGGVTRTRNITKPVNGQVLIGINGVNQASGWTVDDTTGIVTFTTAPTHTHPVTAGFEFDNHVRFSKENDRVLKLTNMDLNQFSAQGLTLEEVKESLILNDEVALRGARYETITSDLSISYNQAMFWNIHSDTASLSVILPNYTSLPLGGPYFFIRRDGGTQAFSIEDHLANSIIASTVDDTVYEVMLGLDSSGTKEWHVYS